MPLVNLDVSVLKIPKNVLSDPYFTIPADIDILLGSSIFWDLLYVGQIKLRRNLPILQKTKLGCIVGGNAPLTQIKAENSDHAVHGAIIKESDLHQQMERFWRIEECNPVSNFLT